MKVEPPPEGDAEQTARVRLSDDRAPEITISFSGAWPILRVIWSGASIGWHQALKHGDPGNGYTLSTAVSNDAIQAFFRSLLCEARLLKQGGGRPRLPFQAREPKAGSRADAPPRAKN